MNKLDLETKLIDANALIEFVRNHINGMIDCNDIARFPTIEAELVRHGRWIEAEKGVFPSYCGKCSECGKTRIRENYCPNCGAKMDLKD